MAITTTYGVQITTVEPVTLANIPAAAGGARTITNDGFNSRAVLNGTTTPPVTKDAYFEKALVAGAATIDLTTLTGTNGVAVDGTGLKVQLFKIKNKTANLNTITITVGAVNGYNLAGAAFSVALSPGQEFTFFGNDATPDIAAADRTLDLAGTGTQAAEVVVVMG